MASQVRTPPLSNAHMPQEDTIFRLRNGLETAMKKQSFEIQDVLKEIEQHNLAKDPAIIEIINQNISGLAELFEDVPLLPFIEKHQFAESVIPGLEYCLWKLARRPLYESSASLKKLLEFMSRTPIIHNKMKNGINDALREALPYAYSDDSTFEVIFDFATKNCPDVISLPNLLSNELNTEFSITRLLDFVKDVVGSSHIYLRKSALEPSLPLGERRERVHQILKEFTKTHPDMLKFLDS